ncbi:hypothetical protein ACOSP7_022605 [Xanthoceras sorbifolium]
MGPKNKNKTNTKSEDNASADGRGGGNGDYREIITDPRFASVHSDPRFQKAPKRNSKVAIDSRFDRMFTDKNFASSSAPSDKRGKPKKKQKGSENPLRQYYHIEEDDNEIKEEEEEKVKESESELKNIAEVASETDSETEAEAEAETEEEEEESTTDEEEVDIYQEDEGPEVEEEAIQEIEKETNRLAVVNMDWRHVKAVDLYVILSSFLPKGGQILSVAVYPSEFGIQRMKEEEVHGPVGLFDDDSKESDDEDDDDEIDEEKLRAYEKSRLRYYYAVVECDLIATADYLYKACDGIEFERSSNKLDLRFIPDTMEFKHPPRDVATEAPSNYGGLDFYTKALQHSNVHISWDEDEPEREKTLKRKFNADQLADLELKEFLASEESENDDEDDDNAAEEQSGKKSKKRDKYLALLGSNDGSDGDVEEDGQDMEVTFNTGLEDISKRILEKKDKTSETIWEAYLRKRREKKKARKNNSKYSSDDESSSDTDGEAIEEPDDFFVEEPSVKKSKKDVRRKSEKDQQDTVREAEASRAELELLLADDKGAENGIKGYNLKRKNAKGKKGKEVPDDDKLPVANYNDPRFSALFTSHLFALDPTDPQFKRSAAYARQVAQKKQKGERQELVGSLSTTELPAADQLPPDDQNSKTNTKSDGVSPSNRDKHELSSLVRSLKTKTKQVQQRPSNGKMPKKLNRSKSNDVQETKQQDLSTLVQSIKKMTKVARK